MSCCCSSPSSASLGWSIYLLVGYIPASFYLAVGLAFEWHDLNSPALYAFILLASIIGTVAAILALVGRKLKDAVKGRKLNFVAACVGGVSLLLSVATTIWSIYLSVTSEYTTTTQGKILLAGGTLLLSGFLLFFPQTYACILWRSLSQLPSSSHADDDAQRPLGRAPRRSSGAFDSGSELDEMERDPRVAPRSKMMGYGSLSESDGEGIAPPPSRSRSMSVGKSGRSRSRAR